MKTVPLVIVAVLLLATPFAWVAHRARAERDAQKAAAEHADVVGKGVVQIRNAIQRDADAANAASQREIQILKLETRLASQEITPGERVDLDRLRRERDGTQATTRLAAGE